MNRQHSLQELLQRLPSELHLQILKYLDVFNKAALLESAVLPACLIISHDINEHHNIGEPSTSIQSYTLLQAAVLRNYTFAVKTLLAAGASATLRREEPDQETQIYIVNGEYAGIVNAHVSPLLHLASAHGNVEIIHTLMSHGAEVNERNEAGENAVHHAIHCGHISAVHVLLSYGADPNNISNCVSGLPSPIDIAAEDGHAEIIRMLIAHGASVNAARNPYHGITPLFYAERNGHTEAAMILREAGALPFGPGNPIRCINPPVSEVQCENAHLSQPALLNESDTAKTSETNQSEEEEIEDIRRQMAL